MRRLVSLLFVVWLLPVFAAPLDDANLTDFYTGESVSTSTFKGKVVYLDFWASWCKPCKRSFPFMNELLSKYDSSQFEIIAINMDEDPNDAAAFLEKVPANFRIYTNEGNQLAQQLQVPGLPVAYLFNKQGKLVTQHVGFSERKTEKKKQQIAYLLEQP